MCCKDAGPIPLPNRVTIPASTENNGYFPVVVAAGHVAVLRTATPGLALTAHPEKRDPTSTFGDSFVSGIDLVLPASGTWWVRNPNATAQSALVYQMCCCELAAFFARSVVNLASTVQQAVLLGADIFTAPAVAPEDGIVSIGILADAANVLSLALTRAGLTTPGTLNAGAALTANAWLHFEFHVVRGDTIQLTYGANATVTAWANFRMKGAP